MKFQNKLFLVAITISAAHIYTMDVELTALNADAPQAALIAIDSKLKALARDSNLEQPVEEISHTQTLSATDQEGRSRLHYAAYLALYNAAPIITAILKEEPELANRQDADGETPLHAALGTTPQTEYESSCLFDVCSELIKFGADPKIITTQGESPYDYARKITGVPLLCALLEDPKLAQIDRKLLISAPHNTSLKTLIKERSITACDENGRTRLHYAAFFKDTTISELLLEHPEGKKLVNMQDNQKETALHLWLAQIPYESFESKAIFGACTKLLECGADPLVGNGLGESALHCLLKNHTLEDIYLENQPVLLALLCKRAMSLDTQNLAGETALHVLLRSVPFSGFLMGLLHVLLQNGANPTSGDNMDETPLHYLVQRPDFRDNIISEQLEAAELLITFGADVDACNGHKETPLHTACKSHGQESQDVTLNRLWFIPLLLKSGADANAESTIGATPLYALTSTPFSEEKAHAARCMLNYHGANPNKTTKAGFTCLHAAVAGGHLEWVNFLLAHPNVDMHTTHQPRLTRAQLAGGKTALDIATEMVLFPRATQPETIKVVKDKEAPAGSPCMRHPMNNTEILRQNTKWDKASKEHITNKIFVALLAKLMERPL